MSYSRQYDPSWNHHYNNAAPEGHSAFQFMISPENIDPFFTGREHNTYPLDTMTEYLIDQEKPYYQAPAEDFMMGAPAPWPMSTHDQPCDPSSPEGTGSVISDFSYNTEATGHVSAQPPSGLALSCNNSVYLNDPAGFTHNNSRSSTWVDAQMLAPAFQGGIAHYQGATSSLSNIQGTPDHEEGQIDLLQSMKMGSGDDVNHLLIGEHGHHATYTASYHNYSDNMTLDNSPALTPNNTIKSEEECDSEQENDEGPDNESDIDYNPNRRFSAARPSRRSLQRRTTAPSIARQHRITKLSPPRRKSSGGAGNFVTAQVSKEHKHPCVFAFAGCTSLWKSKNEWKRHAMTQHLVLESYCCKLCKKDDNAAANGNGAKGKGKMGKNTAWAANANGELGQVFNRKDLFTQHVKRMHEATFTKQCKKSGHPARDKKNFEDWIKAQQNEARFRTGREALNTSVCPQSNCGLIFNGSKGWDDRLEHIWKHLDCEGIRDFDMGDGGMREWAIHNRIVVNSGDRLVLNDHALEGTVTDEDAPGDTEY